MLRQINFYQPNLQLKPLDEEWFLTKTMVFDHGRMLNGVLGYCCNTHTHAPRTNSEIIKIPCNVQKSLDGKCAKCKKPMELIATSEQISFHRNCKVIMFKSSVPHVHSPPCQSCLPCLFGGECIIEKSFNCYLTHNQTGDHGSNTMLDQYFTEHIVDVNPKGWYICEVHQHKHSDNNVCFIMNVKCCDYAVPFYEYNKAFSIKFDDKIYNVFHPVSWEYQIKNYFISMLKYLITGSNKFDSTYQYLKDASYKFGKISTYISGKFSIIRVGILGLFATGLYQTGTMDSSLKFTEIKVPKTLLEFVSDEYYTDIALINRDPSIKPTCMYAMRIIPHDGDTIIIPDAIAKPMNQDNDGDRNSVYLISKSKGHLIKTQLARLELYRANQTYITNFSLPRIAFSEYVRIKLYREQHNNPTSKLSTHPFLIKRKNLTFDEMVETGCQYDRTLFLDFYDCLRESISNEKPYAVGINDLVGDSVLLGSIYKSGAKGSADHVRLLFESINSNRSFMDAGEKMFAQMKKYVSSSQTMSAKGRMQFVMLAFLHDVVLTNGLMYLGTKLLADLKPAESTMFSTFNPGSFKCVVDDLISNFNENKKIK